MSAHATEKLPSGQAYAALRAGAEGQSHAGSANGTAAGPSVEEQYWRKEADKLDALLQTLWIGFQEAPSNGLPTALADYVAAYTGAMRLKLTLMGYVAAPSRSVRGPAQVQRLKVP